MNKWKDLSAYNVEYTVPGQTDRSAMPLGNGELCASVWMDEDGVLRFYLGRTDCLLENDVTAKLGMVRIRTTPSFLSEGGYRQTLLLEEGRIEIESRLGTIQIFVSSETNTIYVIGNYHSAVTTEVEYVTWRTRETDQAGNPWIIPVTITADVVEMGTSILFYHKNGGNGIASLAEFEGVSDTSQVPDFLTGRIFGGVMEASEGKPSEKGLSCEGNAFQLTVTTLSGQYENETLFKEELFALQKKNAAPERARALTAKHWKSYWANSYIFIRGDQPAAANCTEDILARTKETSECNEAPSAITRAYLLTKFMIACCKDGNFPIFYNGFLFNLTPGNREHLQIATFSGTFTSQPDKEPDFEFNPDERSWSIEQLWQNLRLPYYTMLATGDFESLKKMFGYYLRFQKLNEQRARAFYQAKGQHNTEMTLTCGLQSAGLYGVDRTGRKPGESANSWGGSIEISPGLELLNLMLEYCRYTQDTDFLKKETVDYAKGIFEYITTRFPKRVMGKLCIDDLNSVETYFHTVNPTPVIAGMLCVLQKLIEADLCDEDKSYFQKVYEITPSIPTMEIKGGNRIILPAEEFTDIRNNIEFPEMYTVYPFRLYTARTQNKQTALDTFRIKGAEYELMKPHTIGLPPGTAGYSGWHYVGMSAALLGLTEECAEILRNNSALKNPGNRFPAMWGAVHDAVPDSDHGANILNTLQLMLMQCDGDQIYLLPAFPEKWNAKFKLHAPKNTTVECLYEEGRLVHCEVCPKEREKDVRNW